MASTTPDITIPADIKPADGRFGSGPSKVRPEQLEAVLAASAPYSQALVMGTSHRQAPVKFVVGSLRNGLAELLRLPDGYEIILGNGGTHAFWDGLVSNFIEQRSLHATFGEFSAKFAKGVAAAPFLDEPVLVESAVGTHPAVTAVDGIDTYALTHNETSTGVMAPVRRPVGADGLVAVDATSAAGGLRVDLAECDVYYFSPQKALASDGGLWIAAVSPAAIDRIEARALAGDRWVPPFVDLKAALDNSRLDQTVNTPALATLLMAENQVQWICHQGGLDWSASRCETSAAHLYGWADAHELATPFVTDPAARSNVVATIDFDDSIDAAVDRRRAASQRHRRHRALSQAGPEPAAHRHVPGHRPRRRPGPHGLHRPRGRRAGLTRAGQTGGVCQTAAMPTPTEVREQLTGPGGMFEIVRETVDGIELQVYKDRMASLRQIPELALLRGEQTFLSYGDEEWSFTRFVETSNSVAARPARRCGGGSR